MILRRPFPLSGREGESGGVFDKGGTAMSARLEWYRVFYTVARLQSITRAAEALFISQPAVSQSIARLEQSLGCRLFLRTPRGMRLTGEGETLYRYVSAGMEQLAIGEKKLAERLNLDSGEICVGASDMTLQFFLLPHLERFHLLYPGVKIRVTNGPTPETIRLLEQGTIDFGVVTGPLEDKTELTLTPVGQVRDIFVVGPKFAPLARRTQRLSALAEQPLICLESNSSTRRYLDGVFARAGLALAPEFELATSDLIVRFAERNLGVGCVVEAFARESIAEGRVFSLRTDTPIPPRDICVARGAAPVSKAAERLLDLVLS